MRFFNTLDVSWCFGVDSFIKDFGKMFSNFLWFGIPSIFDTVIRFLSWFVTSASIRAAHTRGLVAGPSSCTSRRFSQKKESVYTRGQSNLIFGWSIFIRSQPKSEKKHTWNKRNLKWRLPATSRTNSNYLKFLGEIFNLRLNFFLTKMGVSHERNCFPGRVLSTS